MLYELNSLRERVTKALKMRIPCLFRLISLHSLHWFFFLEISSSFANATLNVKILPTVEPVPKNIATIITPKASVKKRPFSSGIQPITESTVPLVTSPSRTKLNIKVLSDSSSNNGKNSNKFTIIKKIQDQAKKVKKTIIQARQKQKANDQHSNFVDFSVIRKGSKPPLLPLSPTKRFKLNIITKKEQEELHQPQTKMIKLNVISKKEQMEQHQRGGFMNTKMLERIPKSSKGPISPAQFLTKMRAQLRFGRGNHDFPSSTVLLVSYDLTRIFELFLMSGLISI
jgi:hypothetical protein